jgi:two-component system sensor histidine kinase UhpB
MTVPASHEAPLPVALDDRALAPRRDPQRPAAPFPALGRPLLAFWRRRSIRARLLITLLAINAAAALIAGGVTVIQARKSTKVEIAASMRLAEVLISDMTSSLRQGGMAEQVLRNLPSQLRLVRHVRLSVRDAAGIPVAADSETAAPASADQAPAWFSALIAPPVETREVPVTIDGVAIGSVLVTGAASDEIAEVWDHTVDFAMIGLLVNLVVFGVLYLLFGRVLDPLDRLAAGLADLEHRNYGVRLPRPDTPELTEIADRFNALAAALDQLRTDNARLGKRLITAQDDERRRTALELHDEVGPSLFGLKANAASILRAADTLGPAAANAREAARDMLAIIEHLQTINRSMLNRLRPMALGHIALGDLVAQAIKDHARRHPDVAVSFAAGRLTAGYGDSVELTIYRCVQEGLTNVVRHAGATHVAIELGEADEPLSVEVAPEPRLRLVVRDDGRGIAADAPMGHGLTGMQERIQALAGSLAIAPAADGGTQLTVTIPLAGPAGAAAAVAGE